MNVGRKRAARVGPDGREDAFRSDEVRSAVYVQMSAGRVAVALRREIDDRGGDLLGQARAPDLCGVMIGLVDPLHHLMGIAGIEAFLGQRIAQYMCEAIR